VETVIIGAGHLGRYLSSVIPEARLFEGRMSDFEPGQLGPRAIVINTAGKTDLAWCEQNWVDAFVTNAFAPSLLYAALRGVGRRLIHLSSGCVWDGPFRTDGEPFGPLDQPSPACRYSESKVLGDELISRLGKDMRTWAILRLRMPYSSVGSPRNLFSKLLGYEQLIEDPNSVTSADTLARTIRHLIDEADSPLWGRISCVYDLGVTSPYLIGLGLAKAGLRAVPTALEKSNLDTWHKPKRVNTVLYDELFEATIGPPAVEDELRRVTALYAAAKR